LIIHGSIIRARDYFRGEGLGPVLIRSVAGGGAVQLGGTLATFLVAVLLARGLGVHGYGEYGIAMAVIAVAAIPGELGLSKLVVRETAAAASRNDWPTFFGVIGWADRTCLRMSAAIALIVAVGSWLVLGDGSAGVALAILAGVPVIPLLALAKIRGAALQGLHHLVMGQIPPTLLRPALLSILVLGAQILRTHLNPTTAMALNSVTAAVAFGVGYLLLRSRQPAQESGAVIRDGARWLASSIPMALSDGMFLIQAQLCVLLLGILASPNEVGLFRTAVAAATIVTMPAIVLHTVTIPVFARLHAEGDIGQLRTLTLRTAQAQFLIMLLISPPLLVDGGPILGLLFGSDYSAAAPALSITLAGYLFSAACGPTGPLLNMTRHERRVTRAMSVGVVVNLATMPIFVPLFGLAGAAISLAIGTVAWNVIATYDAYRLLKINTTIIPIFRHRSTEAALLRPNLFIVGAPKCGTTAWAQYLSTHPGVFFSPVKEPHYFCTDLPGARAFTDLYDYLRLFKDADAPVRGEASTNYLYSANAAREIAKISPDARIIIFLRDQEEFLLSFHNYNLYTFRDEMADFESAWRLSGRRSPDEIPQTCPEPQLLDYKAEARFDEQVDRYFEVFPEEQIRVFNFRDWAKNPRETYLEILDFLGVPDDGRTHFPKVNEARQNKSDWFGRLLNRPPALVRYPLDAIKKILGQRTLGIGTLLGDLNSRSGYRSHIDPKLRDEIREYYAAGNARLQKRIRRPSVNASAGGPSV
jgi:O-antigen/teichoic acid export membrane protein